jgi:hypothetical protein
MCVQTVGLLAHALESDGITTVVVSLLASITRVIRPPRALEVPFPFGHPLGDPADVAGQRLVLTQALGLLARTDVPLTASFAPGAPAPV